MVADKSLAAEIEAVCDRLDRLNTVSEPQACADTMDEARLLILRLAAEIAALQSRAFEDGARWMRERVETLCLEKVELGDVALARQEESVFSDASYSAAVVMAQEAVRDIVRQLQLDKAQSKTADVVPFPLQPEGERNA